MSQKGGDTTDIGMMREIEERVRSRLLALEREVAALRSRTRLLTIGTLVALILAATVAVNPDFLAVTGIHSGGEGLSVRSLTLLDGNDRPRGEWAVDDAGDARLSLFDRQGRRRMNLSVLSGGQPGMSLINSAGTSRAAFGLLPDESSSLVFADGAGIPRVVLGLTREEAAHLVFADGNGVSHMALGLDRDGVSSVVLPEASASPPSEGDGG
jgi:hypothetical protein